MTLSLAASFECQDYKELTSIEEAFALVKNPLDWCWQLKADGIWGKVLITADFKCTVTSKTGQVKETFETDRVLEGLSRGPIVLVAEYMYGTQWSKKKDREGMIYVFDCLVVDGEDISGWPYLDRVKKAAGIVAELGWRFEMVKSCSIDVLGQAWLQIERTREYEGIVLRKRRDPYQAIIYKLKTEIEDDYVISGFYEGEPGGKHEGRLGGVEVSQFDADGILRKVMNVGGGFSDKLRSDIWQDKAEYYLRVIKCKGKARFDSGALRHPNFVCFRDDKPASDCRLPI